MGNLTFCTFDLIQKFKCIPKNSALVFYHNRFEPAR
uniref:Uncharacterized protein n=1 Tax=Rhizophora mucronata TaxID=61149 RepID=A0A2P2QF41_RHIMU